MEFEINVIQLSQLLKVTPPKNGGEIFLIPIQLLWYETSQ